MIRHGGICTRAHPFEITDGTAARSQAFAPRRREHRPAESRILSNGSTEIGFSTSMRPTAPNGRNFILSHLLSRTRSSPARSRTGLPGGGKTTAVLAEVIGE